MSLPFKCCDHFPLKLLFYYTNESLSSDCAKMSKAENLQLPISTEMWTHPQDCWLDSWQRNKSVQTSVQREPFVNPI